MSIFFLREFRRLISIFDRYSNFLIISHKDPDNDTIGAALTLFFFLKEKGKSVSLFCPHSLPLGYQKFLNLVNFYNNEEIFLGNFDFIIILDSSDLEYAGLEKFKKFLKKEKIINIDHHSSNDFFGFLNIVDSRVSSTCEIIYWFFKNLGISFNGRIANFLLGGIISDTDFFSNEGTNKISF